MINIWDKVNNEVTDSCKEYLEKKLNTPIYGTFLISWVIFHWQFLYTMFFVSEDKIIEITGLLKNDYLSRTFFDFSSLHFYLLWALPFFVTYAIIWIFPRWVSLPAFRKEEEYRIQKRKIRIIEQRKLGEEEIKLEQENVRKLEVVGQKTLEEKKIKEADPTIGWLEEYEQLKKIPSLYKRLNSLVDSIYKYNGRISVAGEWNSLEFEIPKDALVYFHTNDLIGLDRSKEKIELTAKGKFFIKKFSSENNITTP